MRERFFGVLVIIDILGGGGGGTFRCVSIAFRITNNPIFLHSFSSYKLYTLDVHTNPSKDHISAPSPIFFSLSFVFDFFCFFFR